MFCNILGNLRHELRVQKGYHFEKLVSLTLEGLWPFCRALSNVIGSYHFAILNSLLLFQILLFHDIGNRSFVMVRPKSLAFSTTCRLFLNPLILISGGKSWFLVNLSFIRVFFVTFIFISFFGTKASRPLRSSCRWYPGTDKIWWVL